MFNRKECKKAALASLKGRWKTPVLSYLFFFVAVIVFVAAYLGIFVGQFDKINNIEDNPVYYLSMFGKVALFYLVYMGFMICVVPALVMGYKNIYVKLSNTTEPVSFSVMFSGFKMYGKSMGVYWWNYLWIWLWTLAFYVPFGIIAVITGATVAISGDPSVATLIVVVILMFVLLVTMFVFVIYKTISYSMMWYIVCDDNSVGAINSMNISKAITKSNCGKLFVLDLSFIGWAILSVLTLGIGFIWLIPYMEATTYQAYKVLRNEQFAKSTEPVTEEPKQLVNKIEPTDKE